MQLLSVNILAQCFPTVALGGSQPRTRNQRGEKKNKLVIWFHFSSAWERRVRLATRNIKCSKSFPASVTNPLKAEMDRRWPQKSESQVKMTQAIWQQWWRCSQLCCWWKQSPVSGSQGTLIVSQHEPGPWNWGSVMGLRHPSFYYLQLCFSYFNMSKM